MCRLICRLLYIKRCWLNTALRHADVTSVLQEFMAGLPGEAAAFGAYAARQEAAASALLGDAAAAAAAALRALAAGAGSVGAAAEFDAAAASEGVAGALAAIARGLRVHPTSAFCTSSRAGDLQVTARGKFLSCHVGHAGTPVQMGVGDAAAQLAVSVATVAVQVESVAVSVAAPALQQSCTPAALVPGTDVPAQCTVQHCWS